MTVSPQRLAGWFADDLPRLNRAVLNGIAPPGAVAEGLATLLPHLPRPGALAPREAQQLVIGLGLTGASIARHHQEQGPRYKADPEGAFDPLPAGPGCSSFRAYFADLADRTGTGHYDRDTYASLVLWNVPATEVRLNGESLATLPGVTDGPILSYTGDPSEPWFFELVKRGQSMEAAANARLEPLTGMPDADLLSPTALGLVRDATVLLEALRQLLLAFAKPVPGRGMRPEYFMDVFRQFAAHWTAGDIPPSGALDADALLRDFFLGTADTPYVRHVERLMPALLAGERAALRRRMDQRSLPDRLLDALGLDRASLAGLSLEALAALRHDQPGLDAWYRLLSGHARATGAHLMLSKRFLFNPQRRRDELGLGDAPVVSNRQGTTGMDESILDRLSRMRRDHALAALRRLPAVPAPEPAGEVEILGGGPAVSGRYDLTYAGGDRPVSAR
jgi:hypothetical protein